jgi:hypothetical protein
VPNWRAADIVDRQYGASHGVLAQADANLARLARLIGVFDGVGDQFGDHHAERHRLIGRDPHGRRLEMDGAAVLVRAERLGQFADQALEIFVHGHRGHVARGVEAAVNMGDGLDPGLGFLERGAGAFIGQMAQLQRHEAGDQLQGVSDPVIDLAQHGLGAVAGDADLFLGGVVFALQPPAMQGVLEGIAQQGGEVLGHVLDDIVGGARAQGGDGDPAFLGPGDIDHRRRVRQGDDLGQDIQTFAARHVVVEGHDVEIARPGHEGVETGIAVQRAGDGIAVTAQLLFDQPRQAAVIVDVKQANNVAFGRPGDGHSMSGACMTDRNSPSWRMAPAKLS